MNTADHAEEIISSVRNHILSTVPKTVDPNAALVALGHLYFELVFLIYSRSEGVQLVSNMLNTFVADQETMKSIKEAIDKAGAHDPNESH